MEDNDLATPLEFGDWVRGILDHVGSSRGELAHEYGLILAEDGAQRRGGRRASRASLRAMSDLATTRGPRVAPLDQSLKGMISRLISGANKATAVTAWRTGRALSRLIARKQEASGETGRGSVSASGPQAILVAGYRAEVLAVVGIVLGHWEELIGDTGNRDVWRVADVIWSQLRDPDLDPQFPSLKQFSAALTILAASAVGMDSLDRHDVELVALAKHSDVLNAAWIEWANARQNPSTLPAPYHAAYNLMCDGYPKMARAVLTTDGYEFGALTTATACYGYQADLEAHDRVVDGFWEHEDDGAPAIY